MPEYEVGLRQSFTTSIIVSAESVQHAREKVQYLIMTGEIHSHVDRNEGWDFDRTPEITYVEEME